MPWYRKSGGRGTEYKAFKGQTAPPACRAAAFPDDLDVDGHECARMSTAVCDAPTARGSCEMPICGAHAVYAGHLAYCPRHAHLVERRQRA